MYRLNGHSRNCAENTDHSYTGGKYTPSNTFYEILETLFNVNVPKEDTLSRLILKQY